MKTKIELRDFPTVSLTVREAEILLCSAEGKTIRETAVNLSISYSTAKTHRENIRSRFSLKGNFGIKHFADKYEKELEEFLDLFEKNR